MAEGDGVDGASGGIGSRTVFLSYASHDTEIANTVCRDLENRGIRCWIAPRDVAPGALYADAIVRAINESKVLLIEVNALLDRSTPIDYPVAVISKHVSRGKSTNYHFGLAPWGPYHTSEDAMVPGWRYRQTQVGDTVCVVLRTGALGVAWYTVGSCGV